MYFRQVAKNYFGNAFNPTSIIKYSTQNALPYNAIPGPKRIPFIGMLNDIMLLGKPAELHLRMSQYHDLYGDIFRLKIGSQNTIFVRDPSLMRKTFQHEGQFPRHPLPESWIHFNKKFDYQRGLFFMDGKEWLQSRQFFNKPLLKDFSWMKMPIRNVCAAKVMEIKTSCDDNSVAKNIEPFLYKWSVEVVLSVMLGTSFQQCQKSKVFRDLVDEFSKEVYKIFRCSAELMNIPPGIAERMNLRSWKEFEEIIPKTVKLATSIIEFGTQHTNQDDGLLHMMARMDQSLMMRIFVDFVIAAGDTTAFATVWALYLLASNQRVQNTVRKNIDDAACLESSAIKGVVREALRLYPVAPFVGRFIDSDALFCGYKIPKETLILLSLYSAGRDSRFFCASNEFDPFRWQRTNSENRIISATPSASLPFAMGARSCIGKKIAQLQMYYLISMILMRYQVDLPKQHPEVKPVLKLVTVPNVPVNLIFKPLSL
ncbi:cytochrome P450 315a1, mitochondrial isoform X1 [Anopheles bellator]|uniref:cytochrome P450 315a1, mitochondrial isoform X1 n=1 Tax=Anopheles bellator TaxID=139047 RepID=UPI002649DC8D|nr:cytochrome P450 315a1, mitochondrial isoform X1 [Anopheles bellator]